MRIIIIGGVAGGASAAARLRRLSENSEIIMLEKGPYISFANCGLPYYIGEEIKERENLLLQTPEDFNARFNVDVRVNNEVTVISPQTKTITILDHATGKSYEENYDKLILSPGSTPLKPPIKGIDSSNIFTLWTVPDVDKIKSFVDEKKPKSAVVIGGGFIGLEMAENLSHRGAKVHLVEMQNQVMMSIDFEMAQHVHKHLQSEGVILHLSNGVDYFEENGEKTRVYLKDGSFIETDIVMLSIGVKPQTALAAAAGLKLNKRGGIIVDTTLKTSNQDIYAVGDAIEVRDFNTGNQTMVPLAGPANKQGRMVAANVLGGKEEYKGTQGTSIAKVFDIHVGSTGINEKSLIAAGKVFGKDYLYTMTHPLSHAGYYPGAMPLSLKMIFDPKTRKVLGAQGTGFDGVDKRIDVLATSIRLGATIDDLKELELAYAPPFSSGKDPVNMAGFVAENMLEGVVDTIQWNQLEEVPDAQIVDVREPIENEMGSIPGTILIPVDELRRRQGELDKSKTVVVYCAVGIRGYIAVRILKQMGFEDVRNLSGGWTTYSAATFKPEITESSLEQTQTATTGEGLDAMKKILEGNIIKLDACGLSCPGPIQAINNSIKEAQNGDIVEIHVTDPGFKTDIHSWCKRTGNTLINVEKQGKEIVAKVRKGSLESDINAISQNKLNRGDDKTIVCFSGDLDKAIATFIIANGAMSMGKKVTIFFTFWGLNVIRKNEKVRVKKDFVSAMFGRMMPRGAKNLTLSKMNMGGAGAGMIRGIMKKNNVSQLQEMIQQALDAGITLIACNMSMDLMGISEKELIDGVSFGGVASYLDAAEDANVNLFI